MTQMRGKLKKVAMNTLLAGLALLHGLLAAFFALYFSLDFSKDNLAYPDTTRLLDCNGILLAHIPDARGERHEWVDFEDISPLLREAFISVEDERFESHPGIDPIAIARAAIANLRRRQVFSGASTITQQFVRLVYPRPRTLAGKLTEMARALKAETRLSKDEILTQYLNRVSLGNNLNGVVIASRAYFGKNLADLSPSECAMLASLPKAPGRMNPWSKDTSRLLARRNWALRRMAIRKVISDEVREAEARKPLGVVRQRFAMEAPHLAQMLISNKALANRPAIRTSIDLHYQHLLESILQSHRPRLLHWDAEQAAAILIRNRDMEVLAHVGSMQYSSRHEGYNDGVRAFRSAGSTLKPFLYALALDSGYPSTHLLEDCQREYSSPEGTYYPKNFNGTEYGPTTIRTALGNSLNLAAIRMINELGIPPFFRKLAEMGLIRDLTLDESYYGLGLAIGNLECSLADMAAGYAMLANQGRLRRLRYLLDAPEEEGRRMFSTGAAAIITDMLSDPNSRMLTFAYLSDLDFPYRVAWKTGTSVNYRDSWIFGYTPEYTVGVWVGNFDGRPMQRLAGSKGAGPILGDIVRALYKNSAPSAFVFPEDVVEQDVCGYSGMKPSPYCPNVKKEPFLRQSPQTEACAFHHAPFEENAEQENISTPAYTEAGGMGLRHLLDVSYAGWIYDRRREHLNIPFSLANQSLMGAVMLEETESLSGDTWDALEPSSATGAMEIGISGDAFGKRDNPSHRKGGKVQIASPLHEDRYISGSAPQTIRLEAIAYGNVTRILWLVDGKEHARTGPPFRADWQLRRGEHEITALADTGASDQIKISVE